MRRFLASGCCVVYLAFGFVAGAAHVHEAADHHEEMRGLHLDHVHLGETSGHGPRGHQHQTVPPEDGEPHVDARHIGHHAGDARYLNVTARRSFDSGLRVVPAMVAVGATIAPPTVVGVRRGERPGPLRGPPRKNPTPPRAPPA